MAEELENKKVIRKKDPDFPDYLDFDKLRSEGIAYLGKLSGQIWTDHNVHDPGITILEMLCYALLDLGYRTNLPEEDIFTRNPEDKTKDNNFFTPAQILANNPLTITDYRKLLVDVPGVKNAWLEPATDVKDICSPVRERTDYPASVISEEDSCDCEDFLNGLYHVYIDLENTPAGKNSDDFEKETIKRVKKALMGHRNLCEDFQDIYVLCKLPLGVCADIEFNENAEADKTYLAIVEALRKFFTPSPGFYTLQQLLDKQKPIEDIFAGRPYDIDHSHGFIDTDEFEKIRLKKEIHLSDVYNVIFEVPGVKSVRDLSLRTCDGNIVSDWKYPVPENHIPDFSVECSGFKFSRNGMPLPIDFNKYKGLFELDFSQNGKILYKVPSPYLDREIPKGTYHSDLGDYYSIQNEFPRVYGIQEGGLSDDAPALRQAQALQLKGYLLFFDQLLANYLAQLKNIRSLFSLSSPADKKDRHTYFINQPGSVPDLQKLLFFQSGASDQNPDPGSSGSTLVFPVNRKKLLEFKDNSELNFQDCEKIENLQYAFSSITERDIAIHQLRNDFYHQSITSGYMTRTDGCVYYYILTSSDDFALVSKKCYKDINEAKLHAASTKYVGMFKENYRSFTESSGEFSFTIEMNMASFARYLQLIAEDRELYVKRREEFLHHLLARFAEHFTDYAILSYAPANRSQVKESGIKATEQFLSHYDDISSNRGKAYDYYWDHWNNNNISGFEKRVRSLAGIGDWKRQSLCNFVVDKYKNQFVVNLKIADHEFFTVSEPFDSLAEAGQAAQSLFTALAERHNYSLQYIAHERAWSIVIQKDNQFTAIFPTLYSSENEANLIITQLHRQFSGNPFSDDDIFISHYIYFLKLVNYSGKVIRTSTRKYDNEILARTAAGRMTRGVNDKERWHLEDEVQPGTLSRTGDNSTQQFIDLDAFKFDINDTIIGSPDKYTYDLLDKENRFKLRPVNIFEDAGKAREHGHQLLAWMGDPANFRIIQQTGSGKYILSVVVDQTEEAVYDTVFNSEEEAVKMQDGIVSIIMQHMYSLSVQSLPDRWKFNYRLGYGPSGNLFHEFESINEYPAPEEAVKAATAFNKEISGLKLQKDKDELILVPRKKIKSVTSARLKEISIGSDRDSVGRSIGRMLKVQAEINRISEQHNEEDFYSSVDLNASSKQGLFVYRLVDKDNFPAMFIRSFNDEMTAEDKKNQLAKVKCSTYKYLQIYPGIKKIKNQKKEDNGQYKYLVKIPHHSDPSADPLVLFESAEGYPTEEEALKAYDENYIQIMTLAAEAENYGSKIGLNEIPAKEAGCDTTNNSRVFVPKATLDESGSHDDASVRKFVALAGTYPVRQVEFQSEKFYQLFPCEKKDDQIKEKPCDEGEIKYVYFFRLNETGIENGDNDAHWQSTDFYDSPEEAWNGFRFFMMLLCYPGNLYVDCDHCDENENSYRIYIREVLAESTRRFISEKDAWGKEGVQKFICISQSPDAFHNFQQQDDCCYSFYVACADSLVYHPCHYHSPAKRNEIIDQLYAEFKSFQKNQAYQLLEEEGFYYLLNEKGEKFARIHARNQDNICGLLVEMLEKISLSEVSYETGNDNEIFLKSENGFVLDSVGGIESEKWRTMLEEFAFYFPVVKNEKGEYCIEIKLPGFNAGDEGPCAPKSCDDGNEDEGEKKHPSCFAAWKSRCCFSTCEEAEKALQEINILLSQYENYQPLFDCDCREFGIAVHPRIIPDVSGRKKISYWKDLEIVAINPQCYPNPEIACEAVERSENKVNSEGLHIVEHILLRPRCNEDCRCDQYNRSCEKLTDCCITWKEPDDDPCAVDDEICFIPNYDPYSFIATIAMPAWPQRFRNAENRKLIENMLHREAPAHVLLRVLWLAPHDFCCFERKYKSWGRWLAEKKSCQDHFSNCDFMEFLFDRNYECLEECDVCLPCGEEGTDHDPCFSNNSRQPVSTKSFLEQVNEFYCWESQSCYEYRFRECREQIIDDDDIVIASAHPATADNRAIRKIPDSGKLADPGKDSRSGEYENHIHEVISKPKAQVINSRMAKYRTAVEQVLKDSGNNPVAGKVHIFLKDPRPLPDRLSQLLTDIIRYGNKKQETGKPLGRKQVFELLQNSIGYYLDRVCFNKKDMEGISSLNEIFEELRKEKTDMTAILNYWEPDEIKKYETGVDLDAIKKQLMPD